MKMVTLVYIVKDDQVLLGLKKVRFGAGHVNGYGGKIEEGETPEEAAVREVKEEVGLTVLPSSLQKVALIHFRFTERPEFAQDAHVFVTKEFSGEPIETEEMSPSWYPLVHLPIEQLWPSDPYWVPMVLQEGKTIEGTCIFGEKEKPFTVDSFTYEEKTF